MRFLCARIVNRVCAATALLLSGVALAQADSVSMQIIADNDFALFSGTATLYLLGMGGGFGCRAVWF
jgi:hypothetical protein